jgi:proteasome lid subunit RPN8/RPN11
MQNGSPDFIEVLSENISEKPFPALPEYRIAISGQAYHSILQHANENRSIEICGILIGDFYKDSEGPFLEISHIINGKYADNQAGHVTFTHQTWEFINHEKDEKFPNKKIVGWYHTHPDFGIFLSDQDIFIHRNFFEKSWQVAFVFDPIREEEGFFIWKKGLPEKTRHYWLDGTEVVDNSVLKETEKRMNEKIQEGLNKIHVDQKDDHPGFAMWGVFVFFILLALSIFFMKDQIMNYFIIRVQEGINLLIQQNINEGLIQNISPELLSQKLADENLIRNFSIEYDAKSVKLNVNGQVYTSSHKERVKDILKSVIKKEDLYDVKNVVITHLYIAMPGESFSQIAEKIYDDPGLKDELFRCQSEAFLFPDKLRVLTFSYVYLPDLKPHPYVGR